eukprot:CAMPEP_0180218680 /NCGR_PEP_ID=MMETSP0987-20121128/17873_1 /TAXON_ID=697907 /ORGANISM="non described non described, Strain CCMP2293" /LENGTH=99 /DNA_ID=CAMNT_0022178851 /DNA_START=748 /DNA_END=1047 /DNA_ORIENTATION=+
MQPGPGPADIVPPALLRTLHGIRSGTSTACEPRRGLASRGDTVAFAARTAAEGSKRAASMPRSQDRATLHVTSPRKSDRRLIHDATYIVIPSNAPAMYR